MIDKIVVTVAEMGNLMISKGTFFSPSTGRFASYWIILLYFLNNYHSVVESETIFIKGSFTFSMNIIMISHHGIAKVYTIITCSSIFLSHS